MWEGLTPVAATFLVLLTAFAVVLAVELPDKTLVATLVLTTRYRAWPVFVGVSVAFLVQCVIAVSFGSVLTLLPERVTTGVVAVMFGIGAFTLLREGFGADEDSEQDAARSGPAEVSFRRAALTSFGVLFAAEWGDASQLATAGLTAHYGHPFAVGVGAWLALVAVAGIAVLVGRKIRARVKPQLIQRIAGFLFAAFAAVALYQTIFS
ncbi:TMEM165/GDT1 family protein [Kutzneria sp. CA-103260]|uniref:TMEM165/GDT1 family protein n=1 Tax=Kutzneria sp. CA-103260 TaxID=2802641 RepID=UPI001BAC44E8|nr:TMEM165/GDT1 family protein [Kutzneria sp. CA-103260]